MLKKHLKLITKSTIVSDIVYSPKNTSFLKQFPKNKKIYGISMLIEQAKPCFKMWFGKNPSVDAKMLNAIYKKFNDTNYSNNRRYRIGQIYLL